MSPANVLFDVFWLKLVLSVDSYLVPKMVLFRVLEKNIDPRVWCLRGLYPNLSRIIFLGPRFCRNKCPFPKKGTTPRRTWYTKNIQNQSWDHGGKHLWIKFQWPRSCLSLCKSPTNSAPRNYRGKISWGNISNYCIFPNCARRCLTVSDLQTFKLWGHKSNKHPTQLRA